MILIPPHPNALPNPASCMALSHDGRYVAWPCSMKTETTAEQQVVVFDTWEPDKPARTWIAYSNPVTVTALAIDESGTLSVLRFTTQQSRTIIGYDHGSITAPAPRSEIVTELAEGNRYPLISGPGFCINGSVYWIEKERLHVRRFHDADPRTMLMSPRVKNPVSLAVSADGEWLANVEMQYEKLTLTVWRVATSYLLFSWSTFPDLPSTGYVVTIRDLCWSPDSRYLAFIIPHRLYVLDAKSGVIHGPLATPHTRLFQTPLFHPNGRWLYAGGVNVDGGVYAWEVGDWSPVAAYSWPVGPVASLTISGMGNVAAVGGHRGQIAIWDVNE